MPLRVLYLDMNSYFASVEQQLNPELRGRPVVVAAVNVDSTCCIAASMEAKRLGVRTGTPVREARRHKGLRVVEACPVKYVKMHHRIIASSKPSILAFPFMPRIRLMKSPAGWGAIKTICRIPWRWPVASSRRSAIGPGLI